MRDVRGRIYGCERAQGGEFQRAMAARAPQRLHLAIIRQGIVDASQQFEHAPALEIETLRLLSSVRQQLAFQGVDRAGIILQRFNVRVDPRGGVSRARRVLQRLGGVAGFALMLREQCGVFVEPIGVGVFVRPRDLRVDLAAPGAQERLVHGFLRQRVLELERRLGVLRMAHELRGFQLSESRI